MLSRSFRRLRKKKKKKNSRDWIIYRRFFNLSELNFNGQSLFIFREKNRFHRWEDHFDRQISRILHLPRFLFVPPPLEPFILQFHQRPPSSTPAPWPTNLVSSSKNNADRNTGPAVKAVYARYSRYVRGNLNDPCFSLFHGAMAACRVPSTCVYIYFVDYLYTCIGSRRKRAAIIARKWVARSWTFVFNGLSNGRSFSYGNLEYTLVIFFHCVFFLVFFHWLNEYRVKWAGQLIDQTRLSTGDVLNVSLVLSR